MKSVIKNALTRDAFPAQAGAIFFIAFVARLLYLTLTDACAGFDTNEYLVLAGNLYHYGAYSLSGFPDLVPSLRRAPGYPYFLTVFEWLGGGRVSFQAVAFVQCVLDSAVAAALFLLARKVVSTPLAIAAALFYAFHPGAILRSCMILTECLFTFLLVVGVLFLIEAFENEKIWLLAGGAALLGFAVLTRPIAVILPMLFVFAVRLKIGSGRKYKFITIFGAVFLLVLTPWLYRCYVVSGRFVFVQGVTAFQFYAPTRVDLAQWDEAALWKEFFDPQTGDEYFRRLARAETPADFIEAEKTGRAQALENIKNHPREYLVSRLKAYPYFILTSFDNFTGIKGTYRTLLAEGRLTSLAVKIFLLLAFSALPFILSLAGLLRAGRGLTSLLCASVWVGVMILHLPMWIEYRFWAPFVPFQIVSAAAGLFFLTQRRGAAKKAEQVGRD